MDTIERLHGVDGIRLRRRARRQVDTALHWRRFANGLSMATPGARAFVRAGGWSVLAWAMILLVGKHA